MEKILIYRSLGEEIQENILTTDELRKQYEVTNDGFVRNVRAFIRNEQGDIAMLFEPRYNRYAVPGGKVDAGESDEEAIQKELQEELGVTIKNIEWIGARKCFMRGSKGIYKWFARYCYVDIIGEAKVVETDKATHIEYVKIKKNEGKITLYVNGKQYDNHTEIYDTFPGIHTLIDVLPYMPKYSIIAEDIPFTIPNTIVPDKMYIQRYIPSENIYTIEEDTSN